MAEREGQDQPIHPQLSLFDAVSIIIGIVIGSSIYIIPSIINAHLSSPLMAMGIWALGGGLCLVGALCYAELASTYPRMGGDYVYLTRAYGPWAGFFFGWAQLAVIFTASIGMMSFIFGRYAVGLFGLGDSPDKAVWQVGFAVGAVTLLASVNVLGVVFGKTTQNGLNLVKLCGLALIVLVGLLWGQPSDSWAASDATLKRDDPGVLDFLFGLVNLDPNLATAMILVLYAYGGWNDAAFVAADMRDRRQIPKTLILGTGAIMLFYLLINAAYIQGLGFANTQALPMSPPKPLAALTLGQIGGWASQAISILVMISALGAINGLIFTGSRVCSALGSEHTVFAGLGRWNRKLGSPLWCLLALAAISIAMIFAVGTSTGQKSIDEALNVIGLGPMPWMKYFGGFDTLFAGTAPVFWSFFLLTGISLFILRYKDANVTRPFKVPLYPILPLIFCAMCIFGLVSALDYAGLVALIGAVPMAIGIPLYLVSRYQPTAESQPGSADNQESSDSPSPEA